MVGFALGKSSFLRCYTSKNKLDNNIFICYNKGTKKRKGNETMKTTYYWMHKEHGYVVAEDKLFEDAEVMGYDDITDPTSCEYLNFSLYYVKTHLIAY